MSQRGVDAVFQAMFLLTDMRELFRKNAPMHDFDESDKEKAGKVIEKLKKQISVLEKEVL
ncbi:hypothetical protein F1737_06600 [Methanoplanus sp. FWC-SCC4]|uniref:Uncharacterized protein n=1 Tax=Methanochimaera problematica TaxID=2609417 RepID=A0AA97FDU3_9EURY|nr:hypothetical protein [Methanoplanus sp. FWC-SCC4]WOF16399.1 hypothetical protein F1737_06600 [Methanoplanus sp. FWC-SCC4]